MTLQPNTLIFVVEKMREALHCKSFSHFFNKKYRQMKFQVLMFEILMKR